MKNDRLVVTTTNRNDSGARAVWAVEPRLVDMSSGHLAGEFGAPSLGDEAA